MLIKGNVITPKSQSFWVYVVAGLFSVNLTAADNSKQFFPSFTSPQVVPQQILVKFKKNVASTQRIKPGSYHANRKKLFPKLDVELWQLDSSQDLQNTLVQLNADPQVEIAEPNIRRYPRENHDSCTKTNTNDTRLTQVKLPELWNIPIDEQREGKKVRVAVFDDAFEITHPELIENIVAPFDALDGDDDPSPEQCVSDDSGELEAHGTQVLGVLAANHLLTGAADYAEFVPVRMGCEFLLSSELAAIEHAINHEVDIINISWGGPLYSELQRNAIYELSQQDILVVVAAGNYEVDNDRIADYPSSIDLPNILSVAASDTQNRLADWSQYGATTVDIAAPGENFCTPTVTESYSNGSEDGTSYSAPLASGVAASLMARNAFASIYDVKAALIATAQPFADQLTGRLVSDGFVDAVAAHHFLQDSLDKPVITLNKLQIDDSKGNGNGEVDEGEAISLVVTLENIHRTANALSVRLSSEKLNFTSDFLNLTNFSGLNPLNSDINRRQLTFNVNFPPLFLHQQDILFTLEGESTDGYGDSFSFSRSFTLDTGQLIPNKPFSNTIRKFGQRQDDIHYYHIDVSESLTSLEVRLESGIRNLDFIIKKDTPPQFDFVAYDQDSDGTEPGTIVVADSEQGFEQYEMKNPEQGTYHIVVIAPENSFATNIDYTLSVITPPKSRSSDKFFGLSLSINAVIAFFSLLILRRLQKKDGNNHPPQRFKR